MGRNASKVARNKLGIWIQPLFQKGYSRAKNTERYFIVNDEKKLWTINLSNYGISPMILSFHLPWNWKTESVKIETKSKVAHLISKFLYQYIFVCLYSECKCVRVCVCACVRTVATRKVQMIWFFVWILT